MYVPGAERLFKLTERIKPEPKASNYIVFELSCTALQEKSVSRKWRLKFGKDM